MAERVIDTVVVPVVEEVATISTRTIETDHVRVRTVIEEEAVDLPAALRHEHVEIERRTVDREISGTAEPYHEGDFLIIPVVEERLVVEKRLFVVEEIMVRRQSRTEDVRVATTLRKMRAVVEREPDTQ